jgi:hypothetical protein
MDWVGVGAGNRVFSAVPLPWNDHSCLIIGGSRAGLSGDITSVLEYDVGYLAT